MPERDAQIAAGEAIYSRVGTDRAAAHRVVRHGMLYHRTGDLRQAEIYRALMLRHIRYYAESEYIQSEGMRRYDRDFRDSWAWKFVVTWDLLEEVPIFSDEDRLAITNHIVRVVLDCTKYQRWDTPQAVQRWTKNRDIVHNHNTWPALAVYFGSRYFGGHYKLPLAPDWEAAGRVILYGQSLSSKPLEDAASYQWLPLRHAIYYALASGDYTFFKQGHAGAAGGVAMMCVDNLGYQPAFGDHSAIMACSAIPDLLAKIAWATRDGRYIWMLNKINRETEGELLERYDSDVAPVATVQPVTTVPCAGGTMILHYQAATNASPPLYPVSPLRCAVSLRNAKARRGRAGTPVR